MVHVRVENDEAGKVDEIDSPIFIGSGTDEAIAAGTATRLEIIEACMGALTVVMEALEKVRRSEAKKEGKA